MIKNVKIKKHQKHNLKLPFKFNNIEELFFSKLTKNKKKYFLFFPEEDSKLTYSEFFSEYVKLKKILINQNIKKGDKIAIIFYNGSQFIKLYFAILAIGAVAVPINPDLSPNEMEFIIKNSESKMIIFSNLVKNKIKKIKKSKLQNFKEYSKLSKYRPEGYEYQAKVKLDDTAVIIYTSGTTGNPKGVVINHLNILADSYAISRNFKFNEKTRTLCILPLFHNNGQIATFFAPLYNGGSTVITYGKTNIYNFWNYIKSYKVTWTSVMASILSILLSMSKKKRNNSLKAILCGGQVLTKEIHNKFEAKFSVPIFEGYGLTETTSFSCINRYPKNKRVFGSIGKELITNKMDILDTKTMTKKKPYEEGEICIKGYNVACNYFKLPNQNSKSFKKGWFKSGDFGWKDKSGNFFFGGRRDSLIIKGGENIYPSEIENSIYKIKDVTECAVIGIPDNFLGQNICAFIKIKNRVKLTQSSIFNELKNYLGSHKMPKEIIILDKNSDIKDIPKGPTKKILYRKLIEYYEKKK